MSRISDRAPRGSQPRRLAARAAVAGGMLLSIAAIGPAVAGAASPTGIEATLPANAGSNQQAILTSVSCASAGNCTAVGEYFDSGNNEQGVLLTETGGVWATGVQAALPADAALDSGVNLSSVSCASAGNCTAIGDYADNVGNVRGLLLTETAGTWATGVAATLPANADGVVDLRQVSCPSAGNCTAVGLYEDTTNNNRGLVLTETAGVWATGLEASLPADAGTAADAHLDSVSCSSAGNCTAVGGYFDQANALQGLLLTETAGVWTSAEATPPANATQVVAISSVSCASAGNCTAVGIYSDASMNTLGLLLTEAGGVWATGVQATPPANVSPTFPQTTPRVVSCASAGSCTAVGFYFDTASEAQGLMLTQMGSVWGAGVETTLPADAATDPFPSLLSVSCPSAGNCTAVGSYVHVSTQSNPRNAMVVTQTAGVWAGGVAVTLPANSNAVPDARLESVSCSSAGNCTAVGFYLDNTAATQGLLLTESPPPPDFSDLIADSVGVGPGTSMVDKARTAQSQAQAGTTAVACTTLSGYVKLVKAQTPKTISRTVAADVTGDAASIATQLGC